MDSTNSFQAKPFMPSSSSDTQAAMSRILGNLDRELNDLKVTSTTTEKPKFSSVPYKPKNITRPVNPVKAPTFPKTPPVTSTLHNQQQSDPESPTFPAPPPNLTFAPPPQTSPKPPTSFAPAPTTKPQYKPYQPPPAPATKPVTTYSKPSFNINPLPDFDDLTTSDSPIPAGGNQISKPATFDSKSSFENPKSKKQQDASDEVERAIKNLNQGLNNPGGPVANVFCSKCKLEIKNEAASVFGQSFHPDCFTCWKCGDPLKSGVEFYVVGKNQPHCKKCYQSALSNCFKCGQQITQGRIVKALGHDYHPDCFVCTSCNISLDGKQFASDKEQNPHNTQPYCIDCYGEKFSPRCFRCEKPIVGANQSVSRIIVGESEYHSECFVCYQSMCNVGLKDGAYPVLVEGGRKELFCHDHALEKQRQAVKRY